MRPTLLPTLLSVALGLPGLGQAQDPSAATGAESRLSPTTNRQPHSSLGSGGPTRLEGDGTCSFGNSNYGASCQHPGGNLGVLGGITGGVFGVSPSNNFGFLGGQSYGVYGENRFGPFGFLGDANYGVWGEHGDGSYAYLGGSHTGAIAISDFGPRAFLGYQLFGVGGDHPLGPQGELANSDVGAYGSHGFYDDNRGSLGGSFYGARGWNANDNRGYLGHDSYGVWGTGNPWAGYFDGDVQVVGNLSKGGGSFKIDHPIDPEERYLSHSFVESPDMMNVYNGNVTTDSQGFATVELPDYFEALNRDFRYQLTVLGVFAQAIVAEEIEANRFVIRTDRPRVKVSWQVTGIRHDPWAEANRIVVEEDKPVEERGFYLHPAAYGEPDERSVAWVRDPEGMRAVVEMPAWLETRRRSAEERQRQVERDRVRMLEQRDRKRRSPPGE